MFNLRVSDVKPLTYKSSTCLTIHVAGGVEGKCFQGLATPPREVWARSLSRGLAWASLCVSSILSGFAIFWAAATVVSFFKNRSSSSSSTTFSSSSSSSGWTLDSPSETDSGLGSSTADSSPYCCGLWAPTALSSGEPQNRQAEEEDLYGADLERVRSRAFFGGDQLEEHAAEVVLDLAPASSSSSSLPSSESPSLSSLLALLFRNLGTLSLSTLELGELSFLILCFLLRRLAKWKNDRRWHHARLKDTHQSSSRLLLLLIFHLLLAGRWQSREYEIHERPVLLPGRSSSNSLPGFLVLVPLDSPTRTCSMHVSFGEEGSWVASAGADELELFWALLSKMGQAPARDGSLLSAPDIAPQEPHQWRLELVRPSRTRDGLRWELHRLLLRSQFPSVETNQWLGTDLQESSKHGVASTQHAWEKVGERDRAWEGFNIWNEIRFTHGRVGDDVIRDVGVCDLLARFDLALPISSMARHDWSIEIINYMSLN